MSEIPFVNQLGDAIETAIATPHRAPRRPFGGRRRRFGVLALAILLGASGVTIAAITSDPEVLAVGSVGCYESADLSGDVAVLPANEQSPVAACAALWTARGQTAPELVACAREAWVVVIPGPGPAACARAGLARLPLGFDEARAKLGRLARGVEAIEESADCIPPAELAERTQALLDRSGWTGWRAVVRGGDGGPCGRVRARGGLPDLKLSPALEPDHDRGGGALVVRTGPPRSLDEQLYSESSVDEPLFEDSGRRCFSVDGLRDYARRTLSVTGRPVTFKIGRMPANTGVEPPRGDRYAEGCAIFVGAAPVYPARGVVAIEVEIRSKDAAATP